MLRLKNKLDFRDMYRTGSTLMLIKHCYVSIKCCQRVKPLDYIDSSTVDVDVVVGGVNAKSTRRGLKGIVV